MLGTIHIPVLCVTRNSRNYLQRHMQGHAMDNPYPRALCFKEFISINHPKRHINMNNGKFQTNVLFNIQENGLQDSFFLCNNCKKYSALVTSSADKNIMGIPCYTKFVTHTCLLLVKTGSKLFV